MFALEILGATRLRRDGAPLVLGVKKTLALLVLLSRSGALPRARVVALLWPELDESTGRRNLRRELARLRDAGAAEALHVEGDMLALAAAVACDAHAFREALDAGRHDDALSHWHGLPADGLTLDDAAAFDDWLAGERVQLQDARRRCLERSAATHEAQGRHELALQRVEQLLTEDPLQEQRHRDAMRLLFALGRREAALAQYERCRRLLEQELGLTPMAETEALQATLRSVTTLDANVPSTQHAAYAHASPGHPAPAALLPETLPFVGRSAEVAAMEAAWLAGRALLIEGDAGVGKSRLAIEFAASHGPYALARCRSGDSELPYAAFSRGLRTMMGAQATLDELPAWVRSELMRVLPELGAPPPPLRSDAERSRFLEACAQAWLRLAGDSFDAVILDDWHHADAASRSLLALVAQRRRESGATGAREMLVYRSELDAQAQQAMQRLSEAANAHQLTLQALPPDAVLDLVQRLSGVLQPTRFAARLGQATGGNPFFLSETLRHLAEQRLLEAAPDGTWQTPFDEATQDYRELLVPASVLETVWLRVQRLPAPAQRLLEAAALAAEPFAPTLLAPACALSELDVVLGIEAAVAAQLLREHDSGGFAFAHDLVRQAIDASLSAQRRRLVHRRLALGAEAVGAPAATVAAHHEASGDAQRAVAHRMAAGDLAQRLHALNEAVQQWQLGLAGKPTPSQALALNLRLVAATRSLTDIKAGDASALALRALARSELLSALERADALIAVARHDVNNHRAPEGLALLDDLSPSLSAHQQAQCMTVRVDALRRLGRLDEATTAAYAGLALPGMQGPPRATLLGTLTQSEHRAGRWAAALDLADAVVALCGQLGDLPGITRGEYLRGAILADMGQPVDAESALLRSVSHAARDGSVGMQRAALYALSVLYQAQGAYERALEATQQGWDLKPAITALDMRAMYRSSFVGAHLARGELGAAWSHCASACDEVLAANEPPLVVYVAVCTLELFALLGEFERASALLAAISEPMVQQMPQAANEYWLGLAQYELLAGDVAAAARALARVTAPADIVNPRTRCGHALSCAELALAQRDPKRALAQLPSLDALGMNSELRLRGLTVRVSAEACSAARTPTTLAAAHVALAGNSRHAVAALHLHRALAAAHRAGVKGVPDSAARDAAAHIAALGRSLQAYPVQQAAFMRLCT